MMIMLPRLTHASMTSKLTSGQTNGMTYFPCFAFNLSKVTFSAYSYFLLVGLLSVLFVCFTFSGSYFLIKWKVRFCFMAARNILTTHTDKYRMNDLTIIYRIVEINRAFIYLFKIFVVCEYYL